MTLSYCYTQHKNEFAQCMSRSCLKPTESPPSSISLPLLVLLRSSLWKWSGRRWISDGQWALVAAVEQTGVVTVLAWLSEETVETGMITDGRPISGAQAYPPMLSGCQSTTEWVDSIWERANPPCVAASLQPHPSVYSGILPTSSLVKAQEQQAFLISPTPLNYYRLYYRFSVFSCTLAVSFTVWQSKWVQVTPNNV